MTLNRIHFLILEILSESGIASSYKIAEALKAKGIHHDARTIRYHIEKLARDGLVRKHDRGASITEKGIEALKRHNVFGRLGEFSEKIEFNVYNCTFNLLEMRGTVPTDIAVIDKKWYENTREIILKMAEAPFLISNLIVLRDEGETLGEYEVPEGNFALVVISNTLFDVIMRNAGINLYPEFAGLLYWKDGSRGVSEIISYRGTTLSPGWLFLRAGMTRVWDALDGEGYLIVAIRSFSKHAVDIARMEIEMAESKDIRGVVELSEDKNGFPFFGMKASMTILAGLNYLAPLFENGIPGELMVNDILVDIREFADPERAFR
ncbi:NrpR regulatory domain-containing protein [Geoglobus acetivorans]|uniref:Transcription regulator n=1 Tax=Geoglobus acetivorans TaxID=565033 RepID=A0A0A7GEH1_GEOAI|nr:transcription regulator [Geoglobus acetivorans]